MFCKWLRRRKKIKKKIEEPIEVPIVDPIKSHTVKLEDKTLVLIVGHDKDSQGAESSALGQTEYECNTAFAEKIKSCCKQLKIKCVVILRDDIGIKKAYKKALEHRPGGIIELHFNNYNGKAHGCETLYSVKDDIPGLEERIFAATIQHHMYMALTSRNRGLKVIASRGERGFINLSQVCDVPSILIEPFFGDNIEDATNFKLKRDYLAMELARGFNNYINKRS